MTGHADGLRKGLFMFKSRTIIGYRRNGLPIYAIQGASDDGSGDGDQGQGDGGKQYTPPATQADLDKIIRDRVARAKEKFSDYDDLKSKAQQWDDAEAKNRTDLENANANAAAEKARADAAELRALRAEVAAAKTVPVNLLAGSTKEELEASADALLEFRGEPKQTTVTVLNPGNGSAAEKSVAAGAAMFRERRKPTTTTKE